jgi:cytochrome oxidase Cu insertion factor (SCO1/SenC/PrrC family)
MTRFTRIARAAIVALLLTVTGGATAAPVKPPAAGQAAPDFRLADQNGKPVRLSAARGRKVVLVFYRGFW